MNHLTKHKVILYLTVLFVVGGATGAIITWGEAREKMLQPSSPKKLCDKYRALLQSELKLTPEQMQLLAPVFEKRAKGLQTIHDEAVNDAEVLIRNVDKEIAKVLTPEQRGKLVLIEKERQECVKEKKKRRDPTP